MIILKRLPAQAIFGAKSPEVCGARTLRAASALLPTPRAFGEETGVEKVSTRHAGERAPHRTASKAVGLDPATESKPYRSAITVVAAALAAIVRSSYPSRARPLPALPYDRVSDPSRPRRSSSRRRCPELSSPCGSPQSFRARSTSPPDPRRSPADTGSPRASHSSARAAPRKRLPRRSSPIVFPASRAISR